MNEDTKQMLPGKLLIVRHAESEWNALGKWTGVTDVHLSEEGHKQSRQLGEELKESIKDVHIAYVSEQIRSRETLDGMLETSGDEMEIRQSGAINERDYGEYTGKNKWEVKEEVGEEEFQAIRRGWDTHIPGGENLKMVYDRAVPFYKETILPLLEDGKNVMIVAHGNSIRALMKYIESISNEHVGELEMLFGQIVQYRVDRSGLQLEKSVAEIKDTPKKR